MNMETLEKMTRKELADLLYDLNVTRGICSQEHGCGKAEWVRRTLVGCGACKGRNKDELMQAIVWAKQDLENKQVKIA